MPKGDKTGPRGAGPMTGRASGYCAGYSVPGYMNPTAGYGRGWGRGRGRGWCRGFGRGRFAYPAPVAVQPESFQKGRLIGKDEFGEHLGRYGSRFLAVAEAPHVYRSDLPLKIGLG